MAHKPALRVVSTKRTTPDADQLTPIIRSFVRHLEAENLSPNTIESYRASVAQLAKFLKAHRRPLDPARIRRDDVEAFIRHLLTQFKPTTAGVRFRSLQAFFKWLAQEREILESPMLNMKPPKIQQEPPPVLREADLKKLFRKITGDDFDARRDAALLNVFMRTGARRAEIMGLRYNQNSPDDPELNDVDLNRKVMRVVGKGNRVRYVPLDPKAIKALDRYLRARTKQAQADLPWLWLGHKGRLTANGAFQVVRRRAAAAGLDIHPHDFRHGFAHEMLTKGFGESDLMQIAGWNSPTMVRRYAAATRSERAEAAYRRVSLFENV